MTGQGVLTGARTGSNQGNQAGEDSVLVEAVYRQARDRGGYVRRRDLYRILDRLRADRRAELEAGAWLKLYGFDPTPENAFLLTELKAGVRHA